MIQEEQSHAAVALLGVVIQFIIYITDSTKGPKKECYLGLVLLYTIEKLKRNF